MDAVACLRMASLAPALCCAECEPSKQQVQDYEPYCCNHQQNAVEAPTHPPHFLDKQLPVLLKLGHRDAHSWGGRPTGRCGRRLVWSTVAVLVDIEGPLHGQAGQWCCQHPDRPLCVIASIIFKSNPRSSSITNKNTISQITGNPPTASTSAVACRSPCSSPLF
jgi:hypothetical protein